MGKDANRWSEHSGMEKQLDIYSRNVALVM